jgi:hypothetical protein
VKNRKNGGSLFLLGYPFVLWVQINGQNARTRNNSSFHSVNHNILVLRGSKAACGVAGRVGHT